MKDSQDANDVLAEFASEFPRCFLCGRSGTEIHHIARGVHRERARTERCALIRTCHDCHERRLDGMSIVRQLAIKAISDPEGYDRVRVNRLRCRADDAVSESEVIAEVAALFRESLLPHRN